MFENQLNFSREISIDIAILNEIFPIDQSEDRITYPLSLFTLFDSDICEVTCRLDWRPHWLTAPCPGKWPPTAVLALLCPLFRTGFSVL